MSKETSTHLPKVLQDLLTNNVDFFATLNAVIDIQENSYLINDDPEEQQLFVAVLTFITEVAKQQPELISNSRRTNGDNLLHFMLQQRFYDIEKVIDVILSTAPELITLPGYGNKTPLQFCVDNLDLINFNCFLKSSPHSAMVLDGLNTCLYNFTQQFPSARKYFVGGFHGREVPCIDKLPYSKTPDSLKKCITQTLEALIKAYPQAVHLRGIDDRLPIENIYHQYTAEGTATYSTCPEYLQPLLNAGGGIGANFIKGYDYKNKPLYSNMTQLFEHQILVGARLGNESITRSTPWL